MTHDDDIERLQNDVEREVITLRALIPDPRMLEVLSITAWRANPGEEEQGWARVALAMAKRIREYQPYPVHTTHA